MHNLAEAFFEKLTGDGDVPSGPERRREPRFAATGPCYLAWSDRTGEICSGATIQDVSANGMRVRTRPRATPGAAINVYIGDREVVVGEVRHCTENADGSCDIGILIRTSSFDREQTA